MWLASLERPVSIPIYILADETWKHKDFMG